MDFALGTSELAIRNRAQGAFAPLAGKRAELQRQALGKEFPQLVWDALAHAGFLGAVVPREYGGTGDGLLGLTMALEELGRLGHGNMLPILTTMNAIGIVRCGSESIKRELLPKIASGAAKFAYAATEENAGHNVFRIETSARPGQDGYILNGRKVYTSGADVADYLLVMARTKSLEALKREGLPKTFGLSMFIVDARSPGIRRTEVQVRGEVGLRVFTTEYEDVEVPANRLLGEIDQAVNVLFQTVNAERTLIAAIMLGISEYCLDVACSYARERSVFRNTPIGQYQAIQHPLADVKMRQEAVRQLTYKSAWAFDGDIDIQETAFFANAAKYLGAELGMKAVDAAIQTLGGRGFDEQYGLIHLLEVVRLAKSAPVSAEMILNFVGEHTLGLPRSY
jgi:acyl-CoA dehydrogenase